VEVARNVLKSGFLEPGMGIEPTSAMLNSILRVAAELATAARRLNRSAFGDPGINPSDQPRRFSPALNRSGMKL